MKSLGDCTNSDPKCQTKALKIQEKELILRNYPFNIKCILLINSLDKIVSCIAPGNNS